MKNLILSLLCMACAGVAYGQNMTLEVLKDGSQLVTVYRLERPGVRNPVVPYELKPGDTIRFDGRSKRGSCPNFAQVVPGTPILDTYSPLVNIELVGCNLRNTTRPAHAKVYGGSVTQMEKHLVRRYVVEHAGGTEEASEYATLVLKAPDSPNTPWATVTLNGQKYKLRNHSAGVILDLSTKADWNRYKEIRGVKPSVLPDDTEGTFDDPDRASNEPKLRTITLNRTSVKIELTKESRVQAREDAKLFWQKLNRKQRRRWLDNDAVIQEYRETEGEHEWQ